MSHGFYYKAKANPYPLFSASKSFCSVLTKAITQVDIGLLEDIVNTTNLELSKSREHVVVKRLKS